MSAPTDAAIVEAYKAISKEDGPNVTHIYTAKRTAFALNVQYEDVRDALRRHWGRMQG